MVSRNHQPNQKIHGTASPPVIFAVGPQKKETKTPHMRYDQPMSKPSSSPEISSLLKQMEQFEATESRANTGTGARREGSKFEVLLASLWVKLGEYCEAQGAQGNDVQGNGSRWYRKLTVDKRDLLLPLGRRQGTAVPNATPPRWLESEYGVTELVAKFPGVREACARYAPDSGPFAGDDYQQMFDGLSTEFDDTIVLVQDNILHEKILLEYKTAKSSKKVQLDANVHERLSFQMMQYLEAALRYTRCSLAVFANGAFIRYRNKYHVNFHVQADRLANFAWFSMEHLSAQEEYARFADGLVTWLFTGAKRTGGG